MDKIHRYLLPFFLMITSLSFGQKKVSPCKKVEQVLTFIQQNHIEPDSIDKNFIDLVNQTFINMLDPGGLFLTTYNINQLKSYCFYLSDLDCNLHEDAMVKIAKLYKNRLLAVDSMIISITSQPIDFEVNDSISIMKSNSIIYANDEMELKENWTKYLRFKVLGYYLSGFNSTDTTFEKNKENFLINQDELIAYVIQKEKCKIAHFLEYPGGFNEFVLNLYLNSLTSSFDPHTSYFTYNEKEHFESSISTSKFSFGADLDENKDGEIFISRLIPGGPAWRSKELTEGDVLLNLKFPGKDPVDLICSNLYELEELLYNSGSDKIELTVRSLIGQVKTVKLKMEIMESNENAVYSFVLDGEKKIGYISLPGFYTEPNENSPLGCASDLAKELIKLQEDQVEGIILDVRNNGGGSIVEAVDLAGIFIHSGPLCIYKARNQKPSIIKDLNRGTIYDGPLVLMVNGFSASASEILAGMLQDYNRALVVGTITYGKASGQIILPLSESATSNNRYYNSNSEDFIKITSSKYFHLNGTSHQATGIKPDVPLPAFAAYSKINEAEYPSALKNEYVVKDITFEPFAPLPSDSLCQTSTIRINKNKNFTEFMVLNDSIEYLFSDNVQFPLEFNKFKEQYVRTINYFNKMDSLMASTDEYYSIQNNTLDEKILNFDEYKRDIHSEFISRLQKDFYLEETYFIMNDLIGLYKIKK